jgi:transcriptional regulator
MYARETSQENRTDVLIDAMQQIKLCAMVSMTGAGLQASHVPTVVERAGDQIVLNAHLSRNNAQWRAIDGPAESVAIFQGPHAYITPSWYATKQETGKVVPTWGYIAVHAHGTLEIISDMEWLRWHVTALTELHEANRDAPWAASDAPDDYIAVMLRGIIGIRLTVDRLAGSWKLNQHRSQADQQGMSKGLAAEPDAGAQALASAMQLTND